MASMLFVASASVSVGNAAEMQGAVLVASPFPTGADERECLVKAIAYEAGYEPMDGRRAVAEVIFNRTRSGAHPATICGVVFEGSTRHTGCQFTFTCDGSLRRQLPARVIEEARVVADEALAGAGPSQVGGAINYHADYVSPYWAPSMQRVAKIGRHIFYRPYGASLITPLRSYAAQNAVTGRAAAPNYPRQATFAPWGVSLAKQD